MPFSRNCAASARSTGAAGSPSTRRRTASGRSPRRTTSTPSAATGRPTRPSAAGITAVTSVFPLELVRAMFIGMDPPKHDRIKALFQAGFTPKRIADHEPEIRAIVDRRAGPSRGPGDLRPRHRRRPAGGLARDRQLHGHPARGRRGVGEPHELDARGRGPGPEPGRHPGRHRQGHPRDLRALPAR